MDLMIYLDFGQMFLKKTLYLCSHDFFKLLFFTMYMDMDIKGFFQTDGD